MARSVDSISDRSKDKKWEDDLQLLDLPSGEFVTGRIVASILPYAKHWIEFKSKQTGKRTVFPLDCPRFNPDTEKFDKPIYERDKKGRVKKDDDGNPVPVLDKKGNPKLEKCECCDADIKGATSCLLWWISQSLQEEGSKNPVRVLRLPLGTVREIKQLKQLNKVKNKKTGKMEPVSVMDEENGCLINLKFDKDAKGPSKWSVGKGDRLPMTKKEKKLAEGLKDFEEIIFFPDQTKVKADLIRHGYLNADGTINENRESLDPRDADKKRSGGKKDSEEAPRAKGKRASVSSEDASEEESEKPKKKGKKPTSSEDEAASSEDGSEDGSEEDSSEEPKSKKKAKGSEKKSKKSSKKSSEDDDSESGSEDDSEDSEDDSEKPKKKGKAKSSEEDSKKSKKSKGKKDSSEDDSEDDLDSEDLPDPKKGRSVGKGSEKKSKKSKKDSSEDNSEDDDSEDSEDESEDDSEKPAKKSKGKKGSEDSEAPKKGKKKSKKSSEDDD